ncbi:DUF1501 domain-containing protein [Flavisolibacter ginsenosidimutans]|uniref:DUF1501 domain-containing protein n=1 Tax=Flavisolibacter ginsenosidimutans TaxID=661481 RepID=A0A5B8ULU4_9BACT|nr:DUF1501 domain-containing protein [Flavisolibacter ginsenosidimutans]QEC57553.1 DUF1501 domain-containing protein [Flavisolibacter ginsenosidimutans]
MKRRDFIKNTSAASVPLLLNNIPLFASPSTGNNLLDMLAQSSQSCGKVLVVIQQNGGNDGLNTVIPLDKYSTLQNVRSNILPPQANILALNGTSTTGLNPAMTEMRDLYNNGKLAIVQAVSYPNPNFSHFRATDIWFSGSASNQYWDTGWLGRDLDTTYPNYPQNYPNTQAPDPLAVQIGSTLPFSLQGPAVNMGYNVTDPNALLNVINATTDPAPNNDYGHELTFLRLMKDQSNVYRGRITSAYNAQQTLSTLYPASGNTLANQLKMVARLIGGGLQTPIYIVNHPYSHDTHSAQVNSDLITGTQANNLSILSKAVAAFQDDIEKMGKGSKVTGMTFSEFGRRVMSNASVGTDHGTAAPVFFFGAALQAGVIGTSASFSVNGSGNIDVNSQVNMQYDFRQLYATVMQDWLCLTPTESATVLGSSFPKLPIFAAAAPLPLEGVSLTGQYYQGQSRLNCHAEQNGKYRWYALEFSTDGSQFAEVSRQTNTSLAAAATYTFLHTTSAPKMFYRIAAQNLQGKTDYSNTVLLRSSDRQQLIRVFPNPVQNNNIHVEFFEKVDGPVDVTIYDLVGAKVYYNRFSGVQNSLAFRVPPSFSRETHYILEVVYGDTRAREQIIFR